jgi:hypothetical protein
MTQKMTKKKITMKRVFTTTPDLRTTRMVYPIWDSGEAAGTNRYHLQVVMPIA